jgi:hypothetical protein
MHQSGDRRIARQVVEQHALSMKLASSIKLSDKKNWTSCNDSINSGYGAPWVKNVIASFAAKRSLGMKSR